MRICLSFLLLLTVPCFAGPVKRKPAAGEFHAGISEMKLKIQNQDEQINRLRSEIETLKVQPRPDAVPALFSISNQTFLKGGFSLIFPRVETLHFEADDGLGAFVGIGQYFGQNHVLEISLDFDVYPAMTLRYRLELHPKSPSIAISPIIGYKIRIANIAPPDAFLRQPNDVVNSFAVFGLGLGLPISGSLFNLEFEYLVNSQAFLLMNLGITFFI